MNASAAPLTISNTAALESLITTFGVNIQTISKEFEASFKVDTTAKRTKDFEKVVDQWTRLGTTPLDFAVAQARKLPVSFEYELPQVFSLESKDKQ